MKFFLTNLITLGAFNVTMYRVITLCPSLTQQDMWLMFAAGVNVLAFSLTVIHWCHSYERRYDRQMRALQGRRSDD